MVPHIREGCRHNYYCWVVRVIEEKLGVSRNLYSRALTAEGFPNSTGYVEPLYLLPVFKQKLAIGNNGWPFKLSKKEYKKGICPNAEKFYEKEFLLFEPCAWNINDSMLELLCRALKKVYENLSVLKTLGNDEI